VGTPVSPGILEFRKIEGLYTVEREGCGKSLLHRIVRRSAILQKDPERKKAFGINEGQNRGVSGKTIADSIFLP